MMSSYGPPPSPSDDGGGLDPSLSDTDPIPGDTDPGPGGIFLFYYFWKWNLPSASRGSRKIRKFRWRRKILIFHWITSIGFQPREVSAFPIVSPLPKWLLHRLPSLHVSLPELKWKLWRPPTCRRHNASLAPHLLLIFPSFPSPFSSFLSP
jgi:hypothetical protein